MSNTGTGENTISVIQANGLDLGSNPQVLPTKLADIHVSGSPTSLTALSDGTRVYAALGNCGAGVNHLTLPTSIASCTGNLVSVIDAVGLRETGTITVGPGAISVDASSDASRVYVISANDITTVRDDVHPSAPLPDRTFPRLQSRSSRRLQIQCWPLRWTRALSIVRFPLFTFRSRILHACLRLIQISILTFRCLVRCKLRLWSALSHKPAL